jgi:hypothetical protein
MNATLATRTIGLQFRKYCSVMSASCATLFLALPRRRTRGEEIDSPSFILFFSAEGKLTPMFSGSNAGWFGGCHNAPQETAAIRALPPLEVLSFLLFDLHPNVALLRCCWKLIQTALSAIAGLRGEARGLEEYMNDRPYAVGNGVT